MADRIQSDSDDGILAEVARGVERAMDECIKRYGGLVWSITQRYVRDRTSAEDVVQETFTDLWKSAGRYNPAVATESTFIGVLARRRAIDYIRKQNRRPEHEPLPDAESLSLATDEPSAALRCEREDIRGALKALPEESQKIFSLHFDKGMSHPEISEQTGLPLGTVKTRLRRGLIEVRNHLRRLEGAELPTPSSP